MIERIAELRAQAEAEISAAAGGEQLEQLCCATSAVRQSCRRCCAASR